MKTIEVTIGDTREGEYPDHGTMVIANTPNGEWIILMAEGDDSGYEWENDGGKDRFDEWIYLSDLSRALDWHNEPSPMS
jgi:hypothetical protein